MDHAVVGLDVGAHDRRLAQKIGLAGLLLALRLLLFLTLLVLLHKGKGGGLSSLFGGGMQSNLSGSTVVEKNLDYVTIITAILWLASIVLLGLFQAFNW